MRAHHYSRAVRQGLRAGLWVTILRQATPSVLTHTNDCARVRSTAGAVTHGISTVTAHRALGTCPKTKQCGSASSASVMLRRGHRCRAERLAGDGPRRPRGRRAPSWAPRAEPRPARCTPSTRPERIGGTASYAGGYLFLRPPGGRGASRSALLDGCAAERPRRRPKPRSHGVFKPRTDARRGPNQAAARAVQD